LATAQELNSFLQSVDKRAFKRTVYQVRDEEAALDIVQDSMLKLSHHYGDKPPEELPMLFHRILANSTLDWFRRQKTRNALLPTYRLWSMPSTPMAMTLTGCKPTPAATPSTLKAVPRH